MITGCFVDRPDASGADDRLAAEVIERARLGLPVDAAATSAALIATDEARRTMALPPEHCDPADIDLVARVDELSFAMEVVRDEHGLRLVPRRSIPTIDPDHRSGPSSRARG